MIAAGLSARELLRLWERAEPQVCEHARAVTLLSCIHPGAAWKELMALSVGTRDRHLLALAERMRGPDLTLLGTCQSCRQAIELALDTRELEAATADEDRSRLEPRSYRRELGGAVIEFRLPTSEDLEVASRCDDAESAALCILDRCVLRATLAGCDVASGGQLPGGVRIALEDEMERLDPLAVVRFDLSCPACSHQWQARLDLSEVVWSELAAQARKLIADVAVLAQCYHWSEESILTMSARRRQAYLELAPS